MSRPAAVLVALVALLLGASLLVGPSGVAPLPSLAALWSGEGPLGLVMREIRLPRALLAALTGASLGLAGAAMQGYLRNPLAEPGLIGVSGMAALGAVLAIQTGAASAFPAALPLAALGGALGGVVLLVSLAGRRGGSLTLILAGIAVSSLAGALTTLVLNLSPNPFAVAEITFWLMGSLADRSMLHLWLALPLALAGGALLLSMRPGLEALTLGEEAAVSLGQSAEGLRWRLVLGVSAAVAGVTAVAGAIGFVGLVVPHLLRPLVGSRPGALLGLSALGGAAMVLAADLLVRVTLPGHDLKLGVVTALIGAPLFFHLILKTRREGA